jgi:hypothetical protein
MPLSYKIIISRHIPRLMFCTNSVTIKYVDFIFVLWRPPARPPRLLTLKSGPGCCTHDLMSIALRVGSCGISY